MSKRAKKLALIGGALGALKGASDFFQTKAAQEAEMRKEERLAARQAERDAVMAQREDSRFERQTAAQAERDARIDASQVARDERQTAAQAERDDRLFKNQRSLIGAQAASNPRQDDVVILRTPEGGTVAMSLTDPRIRDGLPPGYEMIEGRAGTRFQAIPGADTEGGSGVVGGSQPSSGGGQQTIEQIPSSARVPAKSQRSIPVIKESDLAGDGRGPLTTKIGGDQMIPDYLNFDPMRGFTPTYRGG